MGVVYRAEDSRKPGFIVALKVMVQEDFGGTDNIRRFEREAKILQSLEHPNIVRLFEIGLVGEQSYVAMELLEGRTLGAYIGRPYRDVLPLLIQFCDGMEYLTSRSIIHRDLSPDNVFVVKEQGEAVVKILDFGLAKDTGRTDTLFQFTKTGLLMGKPPYWSPEMLGTLAKDQNLDFRSDIYASGVIFYRVFTGAYPFTGDSPYTYAYAHLNLNPRELVVPVGKPRVPEKLRQLVFTMMAKDRRRRPASFAAIRDELAEILARIPEKEELETVGSADPGASIAISGPPARESLTPATAPGTPSGTDSTMKLPGFGPPTQTPFPKGISEKIDVVAAEGPTIVEAPAAAGPPVERPSAPMPPRRSHVPLIAGGACLAVVIAGIYFSIANRDVEDHVRTQHGVQTTPVPTLASSPVAVSPGMLALSAFPWGRVTSIAEKSTGRTLPLAGEFVTPLLLPLTPGRYVLTVAGPSGAEPQSIEVEVKPGETTASSIRFAINGSPLQLLE